LGEDDEPEGNDDDFEKALSLVGFGKFQLLLLFVCGLANASDSIEILCVSFVLPSAECDLNMSSSDKGFLSSITFLGMMIGGYIWGSLSDIGGIFIDCIL
jgi:VNT family MFS transporter (synaptic vesicle glycoprotein 2)